MTWENVPESLEDGYQQNVHHEKYHRAGGQFESLSERASLVAVEFDNWSQWRQWSLQITEQTMLFVAQNTGDGVSSVTQPELCPSGIERIS
jgi:hypothetical protein